MDAQREFVDHPAQPVHLLNTCWAPVHLKPRDGWPHGHHTINLIHGKILAPLPHPAESLPSGSLSCSQPWTCPLCLRMVWLFCYGSWLSYLDVSLNLLSALLLAAQGEWSAWVSPGPWALSWSESSAAQASPEGSTGLFGVQGPVYSPETRMNGLLTLRLSSCMLSISLMK